MNLRNNLFPIYYCFRPSRWTVDLLAVVCGRIPSALNRSVDTPRYDSLRHENTGLVSDRVSLTSCREAAFLPLVCPSSDGVTIKVPDGVDVLLNWIVTTDEFSVTVTKITSRIGASLTHSLLFYFWPIFNSMNYGHIIKRM